MPAGRKTRSAEKAIAALLTKPTLAAAARECGLSRRTLQRWIRDPEFQRAYRQAKAELLHGATSRLIANAVQASEVLRTVFMSKKATAGSRVTAAVSTLRLALDSYQLEELEERLHRLEEQTRAL
jgi:hypothetical protein